MAVIMTAVGGSAAYVLCPEGKKNGLRDRLGFLLSVIMIFVIASPFLSFMKKTDAFSADSFLYGVSDAAYERDYESVFKSAVLGTAEEVLCESVSELLEREFELQPGKYELSFSFGSENGATSLEKITVTVLGAGVFKNPRRIEARLADLYECECEVLA